MSIIRWSCPLTVEQYDLLLKGLPETLAKLRKGRPEWEAAVPPHCTSAYRIDILAYKNAAERHDARSINTLLQWSDNLRLNRDHDGIAHSFIDTALVPFPYSDGPNKPGPDHPEYIPDVATYQDCLWGDIREIPLNRMIVESSRIAEEKSEDTRAFYVWNALVKHLDKHSKTELEPTDQAHVDAWRDR